MPKKLYKILDDNGNELKGHERKKKLDEMRRQRQKDEQKEEPKEEQKTDSPVSIVDYGPNTEQPAIKLANSRTRARNNDNRRRTRRLYKRKGTKKLLAPACATNTTTTDGDNGKYNKLNSNNDNNDSDTDNIINGAKKIYGEIGRTATESTAYKLVETYAKSKYTEVLAVHRTKLNLYYASFIFIGNLFTLLLIEIKILLS